MFLCVACSADRAGAEVEGQQDWPRQDEPHQEGKVIKYHKASEGTRKGLDATMLKEWNIWKEFNAVERISRQDAQPLIDSGEAEVIPTQWVHTDRNEVLRLQGGQDFLEDLKSRLVACGQFEKADVRSDSPTAPQERLHFLCS